MWNDGWNSRSRLTGCLLRGTTSLGTDPSEASGPSPCLWKQSRLQQHRAASDGRAASQGAAGAPLLVWTRECRGPGPKRWATGGREQRWHAASLLGGSTGASAWGQGGLWSQLRWQPRSRQGHRNTAPFLGRWHPSFSRRVLGGQVRVIKNKSSLRNLVRKKTENRGLKLAKSSTTNTLDLWGWHHRDVFSPSSGSSQFWLLGHGWASWHSLACVPATPISASMPTCVHFNFPLCVSESASKF